MFFLFALFLLIVEKSIDYSNSANAMKTNAWVKNSMKKTIVKRLI